RFKEIDENVRSEIARVLAKDIAELLGDSLEKVLLETQLTAAKQLQIDAQDLQKRIKSYSALAGQKKIVASTDTTDPEAPGGHPEESTSSSEADTTQHEQVPFALTQPPLIEPNISSIQLIPKTVLNEQHSVCPQKKYVHGTRTWNLHRHAKDSMTTGLDVTECIQLPDGYQLEEWVAVHVIDFFNEVSLLFGTISEFCTVDSCSQMTAGPCYTYLWANGKQQTAPTSLPAPEYVSCLMNWVQDQLDDPQVFPPDGRYECNPTFLQDASVIFKRLFRVYAHMYHSHLEDYVALHAESHLNFCFKRFIFFVKEFHMIDQKELNALRKLIQTLVDPPMHLRA
uniref:Uncharacterized protein n=1 Tax=Globisporangium ultimum (strain ATCC 200006 / CBS 805.95 / DAOM BR144) TaxID=431595 RepID=K3WL30_GLOUD